MSFLLMAYLSSKAFIFQLNKINNIKIYSQNRVQDLPIFSSNSKMENAINFKIWVNHVPYYLNKFIIDFIYIKY